MKSEKAASGVVVLLTLIVGCRSAAPPSRLPANVSQLCSVTIELRNNRFIFANSNGVNVIRTVGPLEDAIKLRRAEEATAGLRVQPASRFATGVTLQLESGVPQTIWSSVKQPKDSLESTVPAGSYQVVFRYFSPTDDRMACEAISAAMELPEFLILTTD